MRRASRSGARTRRLLLSLVLVVTGTGLVTAGSATAGPDHASDGLSLLAQVDTGGTGGDVAFWRDLAVVGLGDGSVETDVEDDGFLLVDVSNPARPRDVVRFTCRGAGNDVAVWGDLVFLSGQLPMDGPGCDARPAAPGASDAFAGVHVVSIANRNRPVHVAAVPTNRGTGAHTFTLLPDLDHEVAGRPQPRLLVYTSSAAPSDVVAVPLDDPARAAVVGAVDTMPGSLGCHDLSFFVPRDLALCAGVNESQVWDVSDPLDPEVLSHLVDPAIHHHHSAAFSWDGQTVVLAEENIENVVLDRCAGGSPSPQGALSFYDVSDPARPTLQSRFQLPRRSADYCTAHQMNVVPLADGRDVLVAGWYSGGTTVVDFTDATRPRELAWFRGHGGSDETRSNAWSSYWYDGHVWSTNFVLDTPELDLRSERGLDVLRPGDGLGLGSALPLRHYNFGLQEEVPGLTDVG